MKFTYSKNAFWKFHYGGKIEFLGKIFTHGVKYSVLGVTTGRWYTGARWWPLANGGDTGTVVSCDVEMIVRCSSQLFTRPPITAPLRLTWPRPALPLVRGRPVRDFQRFTYEVVAAECLLLLEPRFTSRQFVSDMSEWREPDSFYTTLQLRGWQREINSWTDQT